MVEEITLDTIKSQIRTIPNFPKAGIQFKDITTVLKQPELFSFIVDQISTLYNHKAITKVVCIESRGFILGGAVAARIGAGFVPIRKPGKLPAETYVKRYKLEYGTDAIEIHKDALVPGDIVLLHDDLLATGGTSHAAIDLLKLFNVKNIYLNFLCELDFLKGRESLTGYEVTSLLRL
jgi:adenine phosphoribosyltransferase